MCSRFITSTAIGEVQDTVQEKRRGDGGCVHGLSLALLLSKFKTMFKRKDLETAVCSRFITSTAIQCRSSRQCSREKTWRRMCAHGSLPLLLSKFKTMLKRKDVETAVCSRFITTTAIVEVQDNVQEKRLWRRLCAHGLSLPLLLSKFKTRERTWRRLCVHGLSLVICIAMASKTTVREEKTRRWMTVLAGFITSSGNVLQQPQRSTFAWSYHPSGAYYND